MKINTIIFDIGNVLAKFRWKEFLASFGYSDELYNRLANAMFLSTAWAELDRGAKSDEEILQMMYNNAPDLKEEINHVWNTGREKFVIEYDFSEAWVKDLKERGYSVYLLSNYGKTLFQVAKRKFKFLNYVDGGVISYEIKHIKPEKEIYETLIQKYNLIPETAVFLDDLPQNTEAARQLGFHTVIVTDHETAVLQLEDLLKL